MNESVLKEIDAEIWALRQQVDVASKRIGLLLDARRSIKGLVGTPAVKYTRGLTDALLGALEQGGASSGELKERVRVLLGERFSPESFHQGLSRLVHEGRAVREGPRGRSRYSLPKPQEPQTDAAG